MARPYILYTVKNICKDTGGVPLAVVSTLHSLAQTYSQYDFVLAAHSGSNPLVSSTSFKWVKLKDSNASSFFQYLQQCKREGKLPSIIHDHGIWLPNNHVVASASHQLKIPRVVSIHGMLEPWAWQYKTWKKRLAWVVFQKSDLVTAKTILSTSYLEAQHIKKFLPQKTIVTVPLGVDLPPVINYHSIENENIRNKKGIANKIELLFLSRIHPKKGIENLIAALHQLKNTFTFRLIIAGSTEDLNYLHHLQSIIAKYHLQHIVHFIGSVQGEEKLKVLSNADIFILPTFSENFGIVVAEALASGLPVITTRETPWHDLVTYNCGWWIDVGVEPLVAALKHAMSLSGKELRAMGARGRQLIEQHYTWQQTAQKLMEVYEAIINDRPIPYSN